MKKEDICKDIKDFYRKNGRIPLKKEYEHYSTAQRRFGSWNKAVKATGFKTNPVLFAKRFTAKDGHICDSFTERIIDDWFYSQKIKHKRNVPYPDSRYNADFEIKGFFVEFFGLSGEVREYDKKIKIKEGIAKRYKINLIKIYSKDIFPENHLLRIMKKYNIV